MNSVPLVADGRSSGLALQVIVHRNGGASRKLSRKSIPERSELSLVSYPIILIEAVCVPGLDASGRKTLFPWKKDATNTAPATVIPNNNKVAIMSDTALCFMPFILENPLL